MSAATFKEMREMPDDGKPCPVCGKRSFEHDQRGCPTGLVIECKQS